MVTGGSQGVSLMQPEFCDSSSWPDKMLISVPTFPHLAADSARSILNVLSPDKPVNNLT